MRNSVGLVRWAFVALVWLGSICLLGCYRGTPVEEFDGERAYDHVRVQYEYGPRPPGSQALMAAASDITGKLRLWSWEVRTQDFERSGVPLRNIIGVKGEGPVVILGTHYDTRPIADQDPAELRPPVPGANDGASGVGVLLELARVLNFEAIDKQIWLAFFDGEDSGHIDGWPWSVGARHMANSLAIRPAYVIVIDMVGDTDQQIYWEWSSSRWLQEQVWQVADELGYRASFIPEYRHEIVDDHTPFLDRGIPAMLIIDFDYPYWHTTQDTIDKVSPKSLEAVGRVLKSVIEPPSSE